MGWVLTYSKSISFKLIICITAISDRTGMLNHAWNIFTSGCTCLNTSLMCTPKSKTPCIKEIHKLKIYITMRDSLFIRCQPTRCQRTACPCITSPCTTNNSTVTNAARNYKVPQDFSPIKKPSIISQFTKPSFPQRANNQLRKLGLRILTLSSLKRWLTTLVTCQEVVAEAAWDSQTFILQISNNWCGKEKVSKISIQKKKGESTRTSITDKTSSKKGIILMRELTRKLNEGDSHLPPTDPTSILMKSLNSLSSKSLSWSLSHAVSVKKASTISTSWCCTKKKRTTVVAANARLAGSCSRAMRIWNDTSKTLSITRNLKAKNPFRSKKFKRILKRKTKPTNKTSLLTFQKIKRIIVPNLKIMMTNLRGTKSNLLKRSSCRKMTRNKRRPQEMAASKVVKSPIRRTLRTIVTSVGSTLLMQSNFYITRAAKNTSSWWSKLQSRWRLTPTRRTRGAKTRKKNQVQICQNESPTSRVQVSSKRLS